MKRILFVGLLACLGSTLEAESAQRAFVQAWIGRSVVLKHVLYSLIYNERGKLGTTRTGQRDGVVIATPLRGVFFQFDGRQGRDPVVVSDSEVLMRAVDAQYEANTLDVRSYRKLTPHAVHRFELGTALVVSQVRVDVDQVKLEFVESDGGKEIMTSLRIKWPLPFSPSFNERASVEDVLRRFVEIREP